MFNCVAFLSLLNVWDALMRKVRVDRWNGNSHLTILCSHAHDNIHSSLLFNISSTSYIFSGSDYGQGVTAPIYLLLVGKSFQWALYLTHRKCRKLSLAQPWAVQRTCLFYPRPFKYLDLLRPRSITNSIWAPSVGLIFCCVHQDCHMFSSCSTFYFWFTPFSETHLSAYAFWHDLVFALWLSGAVAASKGTLGFLPGFGGAWTEEWTFWRYLLNRVTYMQYRAENAALRHDIRFSKWQFLATFPSLAFSHSRGRT